MSECGFNDDDSITCKRREIPESGAVQQRCSKRTRRQREIVAPQPVVVPQQLGMISLTAATHKPTEFFREWAVRIQNLERVKASGKAFIIHCKTVHLAFQPLDDSTLTVTYAKVVNKNQGVQSAFHRQRLHSAD